MQPCTRLRFETGCDGLLKDIGSPTGAPRRHRLNRLCADNGSDICLGFQCQGLADLRVPFRHSQAFSRSIRQCSILLAVHLAARLLQVAKVLDAGMKRVEHLDPNAETTY